MSHWLGSQMVGLADRRREGRKSTDDGASRPSWFIRSPRVALLGWVILLVLGLYTIRLWQLQFLEGGSWLARAEEQ